MVIGLRIKQEPIADCEPKDRQRDRPIIGLLASKQEYSGGLINTIALRACLSVTTTPSSPPPLN